MESEEIVRRGANVITDSVGVRVLDEVALLEVTGDDSRSWLNGQVTNDVRETKTGDAVYALAITVKGRILADVWAFDRGDDVFWLAVPKESVGPLLESFESQIIMEDVEVETREDLAVISVVGPRAPDVVAQSGEGGGTPADRVHPSDRLGVGGRDVIVDRAALDTARDGLVEAARSVDGDIVSSASWDLVRLWKMAPRFAVDFDNRNYPQEAGLEARAVSFNKGCYLGQEVVCTLESRGKTSKRLVVLTVDGSSPPEADADILRRDQDPGEDQSVGRVTSAAFDGDSTFAFGYVKSALAEAGTQLAIDGRNAEVLAVVK
ncbi:MAG: hypothetical protein DRJ42_17040 [Deltaproteobacteria bacterium]|nr:MAG: hypothetical protein DRJ42_17040 [Deltaproteobacteria bacterium]